MATSGTYAFSATLARHVLAAYARIGIRRTAIGVEHMKDAEFESNLLLCDWSNKQPNLWLSALKTEAITAGTATYALDPEVVAIQIAYMSTTSGSTTTDRPLGQLSTVEYHAIPNKATTGYPTSYWFDRQVTPQITLWPTPDSVYTYTFKYRCVKQAEDAVLAGGYDVEIPYRFNTAFVDGLADRLGAVYPEAAKAALGANFSQVLADRAARSWMTAAGQDTEDVPMFITPSLGGYYR